MYGLPTTQPSNRAQPLRVGQNGDWPAIVLVFLQLNPSEQSPASLSAESTATVELASPSRWSVIRNGLLDTAAALGVTIAAVVAVLLPQAISRGGGREELSPVVIVGILFLTELAWLYFGFRRLKANRKEGVILNLLEGKMGRGVLSGIALGIALIAFSAVYTISVQKLFHLSSLPNPIRILGDVKGNLLLSFALVLMLAVIAPVCEEFFFRGIIFGSAQAINRAGPGAVLASVLFAFIHTSLVLSPYYIVWSLASCWLLARCRTIMGPIAAHMTVNSVACLGFLLSR